MVTYGGEQSLDRYLALSARGHPVQPRARRGQLRDRARGGAGAGADDLALPRSPRVHLATCRRRCRRGRAGGRWSWWRRAASAPLAAAQAARRPRGAPALGRRRAGSSARRTATAASAHRPATGSNAGDDGLGDARAGGRGPQPARPPPRGRLAGRLPALASGRLRSAADLERTVLALAGAGVSPYDFGGPQPGRRAARQARRRRLVRRQREPHGVRDLRAAGRERARLGAGAFGRPGCGGPRTATAAGASAAAAPSDADSTGAALQALAAAGGGGSAVSKGVRHLRARPARRRRLPAGQRRRLQLAVDGVGGPGPDRRRGEPGVGHERRAAAPSTTSPPSRPSDGHYRYSRRRTRPRSGSPPRRCSRSTAARSRSGGCRGPSEPGGLPAPRVRPGSDGPGSSAAGGGRGGRRARRPGPERGSGGRAGGAMRGHGAGAPRPGRLRGVGRRDRGRARGRRACPEEGTDGSRRGRSATTSALGRSVGSPRSQPALGGGFLWYRRRLP